MLDAARVLRCSFLVVKQTNTLAPFCETMSNRDEAKRSLRCLMPLSSRPILTMPS